MNLPTKLTFLRMILIPVFVTLFFVNFPFHCVAATGVFVIASFTDFLDGYLARKYDQVTNLGKFLDPIADKMLVACALFAIVLKTGEFQIWTTVCAMIILCRELMISGFRIVASSKNVVLAADKLGKIKTVLQMCALICLLPITDLISAAEKASSSWQTFIDITFYIGFALLALSTIMAIVSGINYIVKNKQVLKD
ncbi:MAG: CDP-diacylglycerol--glycerol-3-phosphate 3-phosphatidyltransferase [Clostridia bacterium]|jgi:CDP-diacylglycerol--glycerol-3-phosphate 3-phosphatidyltransferase|nr:CDP-diacylglycerol--glycerol-3-phosphate 3-phosphatidyltransferase [Clostridia bacterium]